MAAPESGPAPGDRSEVAWHLGMGALVVQGEEIPGCSFCVSGREQWSGADTPLPVFADQTISAFGLTGVEANVRQRSLEHSITLNTRVPGVRMSGDGRAVATKITERTCD